MNTTIKADEAFDRLIAAMNVDNWVHFLPTPEQKAAALPHIEALMAAGYFADDPDDLDGSFWQMAASEATEAPIYFNRAPDAWRALDEILNAIFDGPVVEDSLSYEQLAEGNLTEERR